MDFGGFPRWSPPPPARNVPAVGELRILIVDDSPRVRRTIREVVSDLASDVEECSDGDQVLARYEVFRPDWVLMDIRMARTDGIRATGLLTAAHPEAKVVVVSDFEQADLRLAAREAGARHFVPKSNLLELRNVLTDGGEKA